jgi:hypothetical protein
MGYSSKIEEYLKKQASIEEITKEFRIETNYFKLRLKEDFFKELDELIEIYLKSSLVIKEIMVDEEMSLSELKEAYKLVKKLNDKAEILYKKKNEFKFELNKFITIVKELDQFMAEDKYANNHENVGLEVRYIHYKSIYSFNRDSFSKIIQNINDLIEINQKEPQDKVHMDLERELNDFTRLIGLLPIYYNFDVLYVKKPEIFILLTEFREKITQILQKYYVLVKNNFFIKEILESITKLKNLAENEENDFNKKGFVKVKKWFGLIEGARELDVIVKKFELLE